MRTLSDIDPGQGLVGTPLTNKFYDVTPDGERMLMAQSATVGADGDEPRLFLIQNFFEELKRRLPPP